MNHQGCVTFNILIFGSSALDFLLPNLLIDCLNQGFESNVFYVYPLEIINSEKANDFNGCYLKISFFAEGWVIEGRATFGPAVGQAAVNVDTVALPEKSKQWLAHFWSKFGQSSIKPAISKQ